MMFSLSTRWNASRHTSGEAMIEEILSLGFTRVELSYDVTLDLIPGVRNMVAQGAVAVDTVHAYCPVPVGAPLGHPELFTLASTDSRERRSAVTYLRDTIRFAAEIGARVVVAHAGHVDMRRYTPKLSDLYTRGKEFSSRFERKRLKLMNVREKRAPRQIEYLTEGIEALLPDLEASRVTLALENLPNWEGIPTEMEVDQLVARFQSERLRCWYDIGHGFTRECLGVANQTRWVQKLQPFIVGIHIHDAMAPDVDHLMPPRGSINLGMYKALALSVAYRVIEIRPGLPADDIREGLDHLRTLWSDAPAAPPLAAG